MKKIFLLLTVSVLLFSCDKAEKEFDKKINNASTASYFILMQNAIIYDQVVNAWNDAIFKNVTPSGKYCSDISEAIEELTDSIQKYELDDKIIQVSQVKN